MLAVSESLRKILQNNHLSDRIQPEEPFFRDENWRRRLGSNEVRLPIAAERLRKPHRGAMENRRDAQRASIQTGDYLFFS